MSASPSPAWIKEKSNLTLDPPQAANALKRLADAWPANAAPLPDTVESFSLGEDAILHLLAFSPAAVENIVHDPQALIWLATDAGCTSNRSLSQMQADLAALPNYQENDDHFAALRRLKSRQSLRIALREISQCAPLSETAAELSDLAELSLTHVFTHWNTKYRDRWGSPESDLAVIALGKFGGRELNFSSDIDLIFVYSNEGQLNINFSYKEFFNRLCTKIVNTFSDPSPHGPLFRIDLRLRPDGSSGALVRSLESTENYYAAYGETWERMMLIKARLTAGDAELGYEFSQRLQPFVFPRHLTAEVLQEIAHLKHRIDTEYLAPADHGREIKRGRGGIREIEFIVQSLQLLHGARHPFIQQTNTLKTIEALRNLDDSSLLSPHTTATLAEAYNFLRTLEHRIQIAHDQQTHLVPTEPKERNKLAASLRFDSLAAFDARLADTSASVRALFDSQFADNEETNNDDAPLDLAVFESPDEAAKTLGKLGEETGISPRTRRVYRRLRPSLLQMLGNTVEPDLVLNRLLRFVENYGIRATLFELLVQHPGLLEWLARLFDSSAFASEIAISHPELAEEAAQGTVLDSRLDLEDYLAAFNNLPDTHEEAPLGDRLRLFRSRQILRIALRDVLELAPIDDILAEYTALAEACLVACAQYIPPKNDSPLTIIALGKFGARELSYGSDLDIVFVGDNLPAAHAITAEFSRYSSEGPLYEIDTRLRPEGDSGPLTTPLQAFEQYFSSRAALWEAQALTKARAVHGPESEDFLALARAAWSRFGAKESLFAEIRSMLQKIYEHRGKSDNSLNIKTNHGGIISIEFAVQAHQMRENLWNTNTLQALNKLTKKNVVPAADASRLENAYKLYRRTLFVLRRQENRSVNSLPAPPEIQEKLARRLDFPSRTALLEALEQARTDTASICDRLLA